MINILSQLTIFFLQALIIVCAIVFTFSGILALFSKAKLKDQTNIKIKKLNKHFENITLKIKKEIEEKKVVNEFLKKQKYLAKQKTNKTQKRIFVLNFIGDIKASQVDNLREEVTAILTIANNKTDEVLLRLESPGGMVHGYGLAASQLQRITDSKLPLTISVDKVAASGGYMMACVANKIICAPFAIIGSIGVVAQLPNFNRFLKKHDIDFEQITAGEYKRTLTLFGENTEQGRNKMKAEVEEVHKLFKDFINMHRPQIDITKTATGEHWFATQAISLNLVDHIQTSDDYLLQQSKTKELYEISWIKKKNLKDKISTSIKGLHEKISGVL